MCIMEVRPGQHDSTIAQAQHHNTQTIVGDLTMWRTVLVERARHESGDQRLDTEAAIAEVDQAHRHLTAAAAGLLGLFGAEVGRHVEHWTTPHPYVLGTHVHEGNGNERRSIVLPPSVTLASIAAQDADRARMFETR